MLSTRAATRAASSLDPRSGAPVVDAPAAVSVLAASAMQADAWSTALTVLGLDGLPPLLQCLSEPAGQTLLAVFDF